MSGESAPLDAGGGRTVYRFHARDLHLVLGPGAAGKPVRDKVTIDCAPERGSRRRPRPTAPGT